MWAAVVADNPDFVTGSVEGSLLRITVAAAGARSVRATLDDLLAALSTSERARRSSAPEG